MSSNPIQASPVQPISNSVGDSAGLLKALGAITWALSLGVIGLWILVGSGLPGFLDRLPTPQRAAIGIGMLCGGQLIFLMLVARRFFPRVPNKLASSVHWMLLVVGVLCLLFVLVAQFKGGGA